MPAAPILRRPWDILVVLFFVSHIPITLFIDSQAVLPRSWFPAWATDLMDWYLETYGDPLCKHVPNWFRPLVWNELALQLPFFFYGAWAFAVGDARVQKPAVVYGLTTAATLLPILGELLLAPGGDFARAPLLAFYTPYLVLPLYMGLRMLFAVEPFLRVAPKPRKKRA
ncbi:hypothetical protein WJX81_005976 [Elliptochloris bilobata]|uniref:EXPERA domain-containing protein n=1 Tax=Elliptochloris bilobata TaxID=381761 RepID=A0AAW1RPT6_9CHLO